MDGEMLRSWGKGWDWERGIGGGAAAGSFFFFPFFLSLSPAAVPVSPIWWKSNSTLALIIWQLEFTYLVNSASGFGFQLVSLWLLRSPRGWWEQDGGGGARCVGWERIQYDGEGGGRGTIHGEQRWRKNACTAYSDISRRGGRDRTCLVSRC